MPRRAIITGVNGQDGSYLAELLLKKGYRILGTLRRHPPAASDRARIDPHSGIEIVDCDLTAKTAIEELLHRYQPDEIYNLAARASSSDLWTHPIATGEVNALAVVRFLDAIDRVDARIRFVQASSSEVFGNATEVPQTESTAFRPRNPYGVAKAFGHWMTSVYRERRRLFACSCILYNHESPRRGEEFVTRKISQGVAKIKLGLSTELRLGDLEARRDWGFAGDYVRALWLSLQQSTPGDYIVATGETHSVREFCHIAFSHVGLRYEDYVVQDNEYVREPESGVLVGDSTKANRILGWTPSVTFEGLVKMLVDEDLRSLSGKQDTQICSSKTVPITPTTGKDRSIR
ncbi:MAG TPA: GDP-mannose 4,6-dehydratase [Candidatus Sulfotelmatobacter sp.]|nr:GDP-mannose 4,6-dehydratase [Candidatus Sulfotelmatobacter sp.]